MKRILVTLGMLVSFTVCAQETLFYKTTENVAYLTGKPTMSFNNGPVMTSWIKLVSLYEDRFSYDLIQVHCPTGMWRILQRQDYVNGGYSGNKGFTNPDAQWNNPIPNSLGASLKSMC